MPEHPFAVKLREHARRVRAANDEHRGDETYVPLAFMPFDPDDADALADVIEAAKALGLGYPDQEPAGAHVSFHPDGGPATHWKGYADIGDEDWERTILVIARFRAALFRLAERVQG